jgi:hypothetical protein
MRKALLVLTLLALAAQPLLAADPANVAGKWKITTTSPRGERVLDYTIVQDKEAITLTWPGRDGQEMKAEGTVTGNDIAWSFSREANSNGKLTITYTGKVEGDTMKGTSESPMGKAEWKGERVKAQ